MNKKNSQRDGFVAYQEIFILTSFDESLIQFLRIIFYLTNAWSLTFSTVNIQLRWENIYQRFKQS